MKCPYKFDESENVHRVKCPQEQNDHTIYIESEKCPYTVEIGYVVPTSTNFTQYDFFQVQKFVLRGDPLYVKKSMILGNLCQKNTLQSVINVRPTFINSRSYSLIKGLTFIKIWKTLKKKNKRMTAMPRLMQKLIKILMPYVYSRPYIYSFWTRLVNPIPIRGADYALQLHTTAPSDLWTISLLCS